MLIQQIEPSKSSSTGYVPIQLSSALFENARFRAGLGRSPFAFSRQPQFSNQAFSGLLVESFNNVQFRQDLREATANKLVWRAFIGHLLGAVHLALAS
ncbi:MAG: hypothetical protein DCC55_24075 [Chloroflexi bacterium]|nr:MAG: hypothetical protein DCC55_24075 [Chloroflexota bacterium]